MYGNTKQKVQEKLRQLQATVEGNPGDAGRQLGYLLACAADGRLRIKDVKTPKARRRIHMAPQTIAALHNHRRKMLAEGHLRST
jgi:hypothetical protein